MEETVCGTVGWEGRGSDGARRGWVTLSKFWGWDRVLRRALVRGINGGDALYVGGISP